MVTFENIHHAVCEVMLVDYEDSFLKSQKRIYTEARYMTCYMILEHYKKELGFPSLAVIGNYFHYWHRMRGLDHASVLHARTIINEFIFSNGCMKCGKKAIDIIEKVKSMVVPNPFIEGDSTPELLCKLAFG
jgi:chromosomal replication initiation ATPase DnaA